MAKKSVLPRSRGRVTRALKKRKARTAAIVGTPSKHDRAVTKLAEVGRKLQSWDGRASPTLPVDKIQIGHRHRRDVGDIGGLAQSINERGLLQPIVVTPANKLVAGMRRILAWKKSRFAKDPIPVRIIDLDKVVLGERDENVERKAFTASECVAIARECEPIEKAMAIVRQREHGKTAPGREAAAPADDAGKVRDRLAALVGMGRTTLERARAVVDAAEREPEKFGPLLQQMDRNGSVNAAFKRLTNLEQSDKLRKEPPGLPGKGPYRTGVIDMPWASEPDGESPSETGRGYYKYPTMNTPEMIEFGDNVVPLLHAEGGHFWFWTTNFHLLEGHAFRVLDAWSAKAEAAGVGPIKRIGKRTWVKDVMGRGQVFRGQTEDVILCKFGKKPPALATVLSTRLDGAVREDSRKPDNFYADVEAATPASRYFELFARRTMPDNWDGFGDQVGTLGEAIREAAADKNSAEVLAAFDNAWREPHRVVRPKALVNGEMEIAGNFLDIIAAKAAAGEIAWHEDGNGFAASIAQFDADDFRNVESLGVYGALKGVLGGVYLSRSKSRVDVIGYADDRNTSFMHSTMPVGKLKRFLTAWSKASTMPVDPPKKSARKARPAAAPPAPAPEVLSSPAPGVGGAAAAAAAPPARFISFGNIPLGLLDALGAIERGEPIDFNPNDTVIRGLYVGTRKRRLTKAGAERLAELRAWHAKAFPVGDPEPTLPGIPPASAVENPSTAGEPSGADRQLELDQTEKVILPDADRPFEPGPAEKALEGRGGVFESARGVRARVDAAVLAGPHVEVRVNTHRALYEAFDAISHDSGAGAGYAAYPVPQIHVDGLDQIEASLAGLSAEELSMFAIGCETEAQAIIERAPDLARARALLDAFSRGWWKHDEEAPLPGSVAAAPAGDDQLEIPAFLRRQASTESRPS